MDFTSKHFEIIDLYNLVPDSEFNVETNPEIVDMWFYEGLAKALEMDDENRITGEPDGTASK